MKERFLETKKVAVKIIRDIGDFLTETFGAPLTYDLAVAQLEHKPSCSKTISLIKSEQDSFVNMHADGGAWGINTHLIPIKQKLVECPECHARKKYSG